VIIPEIHAQLSGTLSKATLYLWLKKYEQHDQAGLTPQYHNGAETAHHWISTPKTSLRTIISTKTNPPSLKSGGHWNSRVSPSMNP
jgi:hypothetical protein